MITRIFRAGSTVLILLAYLLCRRGSTRWHVTPGRRGATGSPKANDEQVQRSTAELQARNVRAPLSARRRPLTVVMHRVSLQTESIWFDTAVSLGRSGTARMV